MANTFVQTLGHAKWYVNGSFTGKSPLTARELFGLFLIVGCGLLVAWYLRRYLRPLHDALNSKLPRIHQWVPTIVGVSSGAALMAMSLNNYLLAPNVTPADAWLIGLQWAIGLCWVLGIYTRYAAYAMGLLLAMVLFRTGPLNVMEHFEYLAAAVYLAMFGRGRVSIEESIKSLWKPRYKETAGVVATPLYRTLAGISVVTLALSEKVLNLPLGISFLQSNYSLDFISSIGTFRGTVLLLGGIELLFGLMLVTGITPRIAVSGLAFLTILNVIVLGSTEFWGHLYFVGLFAAVWISTPTTLHAARKHFKRPKHAVAHHS